MASNYNQADSQAYYIRHKYFGGFAQDSWRVSSTLTLNYGVRWDRMEYWSEKYNQIPTFLPGEQSVVYPNAPVGLVYVGDKGVPSTLVPSQQPLLAAAGLGLVAGLEERAAWQNHRRAGKTSIRAGYGIYYSVIEGNIMAIDEPQPPYGLSYTSPGPPLFATPFITAANGSFHRQSVPADLSAAERIAPASQFERRLLRIRADRRNDRASALEHYPYNENYFSSIERQIGAQYRAERELCRLPGASSAAGLFGESRQSGLVPGVEQSERGGAWIAYLRAVRRGHYLHHRRRANDPGNPRRPGPGLRQRRLRQHVGNSNYNSLQVTLRHSARRT